MHFAAFLLALATATLSASSAFAGCYDPLRMQAPRSARQLVVLVDRTTPTDPIAWPAFLATARVLAGRPGQRIAVVAFAGLARGESLSTVTSLVVEPPLVDQAVVDDLPIAPYRRSQRCVEEGARSAAHRVIGALNGLVGTPGGGELMQSEIAYSVRKAIADFSGDLETTILIYSDGFEHSRDGQSFYVRGEVRAIEAAQELNVLQRRGLGAMVGPERTSPHVLWFGLMAVEQKRYFAPTDEAALAGFWRAALSLWGVREAQLGLTLTNPKLP